MMPRGFGSGVMFRRLVPGRMMLRSMVLRTMMFGSMMLGTMMLRLMMLTFMMLTFMMCSLVGRLGQRRFARVAFVLPEFLGVVMQGVMLVSTLFLS